MRVRGVKTVDDHIIVILPLGVDILFMVEGHGNVGYLLAAEENQVALLHIGSIDTIGQSIVLLIGIAWNDVASHAVGQLHQTATIYTLPACSTPEIGSAKKGASVTCNNLGRCAWIHFITQAYRNIVSYEPATALTWQHYLHTFLLSCIQRG